MGRVNRHRYRSKSDVRPPLRAMMPLLNEGTSTPQGTMTVAAFAEQFFFPHIESEYKPSTIVGYKDLWKRYLRPQLQRPALRDFASFDATKLLARISAKHIVGRQTLRLCKALLSGIFTFAKQEGVINGINPAKDARIPKGAAPSKGTHAVTADEVIAMLSVLTGQAKLGVALMYFCALRPGEARGAWWEDYADKTLRVRRSVWRTHVTELHPAESLASVPVCATLANILREHRSGDSGYILTGRSGKPLDLHNLANRVVIPTLRAAGIQWYGWYALRRGAAALVTQIESPLVAKGFLRHSDLATTQRHYIKPVPEEALRVAAKLDALFGAENRG